MSLFTTLLLLSQVGSGGNFAPPVPTISEPPAPSVVVADPGDASAGPSPAEPPPVDTAVEPPADSPADSPATTPTLGDSGRVDPAPDRPVVRGSDRPAARPAAPATIASNAAQTSAGPANSQALQVASSMMEEILVLDDAGQHSLRKVRLAEALSRLGDPALQATAIRAYWELARAIANARYAADKVRMLSEVSPPNDESERALLEEALTAAEASEAAAQDQLLSAQYGLVRVTGLPAEELLPWPADAPLVSSYRTQFETIFAGRPAPLNLRQIHHGLPGKLLLIEKRVAAVAAAEGATDTVLQAYRGGRGSLSQLLPTLDRLDLARRAFLDSIVDYNDQIAEYAVSVVGTGYGVETLVATLIKTPVNDSSLVNIPRDVRQAAANQP